MIKNFTPLWETVSATAATDSNTTTEKAIDEKITAVKAIDEKVTAVKAIAEKARIKETNFERASDFPPVEPNTERVSKETVEKGQVSVIDDELCSNEVYS